MKDKKYLLQLTNDSGQVMLTIDINGKVETDFPEGLDEFSQRFINQIEISGKKIVNGYKEALVILKEFIALSDTLNLKPDWGPLIAAKNITGYYKTRG